MKYRYEFRNLVGTPEEEKSLGGQKLTWVGDIQICFQEIELGDVDWIDLAYDRGQ
jgi:hypothetical protein